MNKLLNELKWMYHLGWAWWKILQSEYSDKEPPHRIPEPKVSENSDYNVPVKR